MKKPSAKKKISFKFSDPVMSQFADFMVGQIVGINGEIVGVKEKLTGVEEKLTGVEEKLTGVEERLTGVEGQIVGINGEIVGIHKRLDTMQEEINHHGILLESHDDNFGRVFEVLGGHSKKLDNLTEMAAENTVDIQALKVITSAHTDMHQEHKRDFREIKKGFAEIRQEVKKKADIKDFDFLVA